MNDNTKKLFAEREQNLKDLLAMRPPKRVPVFTLFGLEAAAGLAEINIFDCHYDLSRIETAFLKLCEVFYSDTIPAYNHRFPAVYDLLGSKNWVLGSNGAVQ